MARVEGGVSVDSSGSGRSAPPRQEKSLIALPWALVNRIFHVACAGSTIHGGCCLGQQPRWTPGMILVAS